MRKGEAEEGAALRECGPAPASVYFLRTATTSISTR